MSFPLSRPKPVVAQWHEEAALASPITKRMTRTHRISRIGSRAEMTAPGGTVGADDCETAAAPSRRSGVSEISAFGLSDSFAARRFNPARWAGSVASSASQLHDFSTAEDRLGQRIVAVITGPGPTYRVDVLARWCPRPTVRLPARNDATSRRPSRFPIGRTPR